MRPSQARNGVMACFQSTSCSSFYVRWTRSHQRLHYVPNVFAAINQLQDTHTTVTAEIHPFLLYDSACYFNDLTFVLAVTMDTVRNLRTAAEASLVPTEAVQFKAHRTPPFTMLAYGRLFLGPCASRDATPQFGH